MRVVDVSLLLVFNISIIRFEKNTFLIKKIKSQTRPCYINRFYNLLFSTIILIKLPRYLYVG